MINQTRVIIAAAACLALSGHSELLNPSSAAATPPLPIEYVTIKGELFVLEVAATDEARTHGLMGRREIAPERGMLFVFLREEEQTFWMAHTLAELDIVFLDAAGRVTAFHTMRPEAPQRKTEPEWHYHQRLKRYSSKTPARFAIEFKAGTLSLLKLDLGEALPLDVKRLAEMAR